jgi:hypothetical protein
MFASFALTFFKATIECIICRDRSMTLLNHCRQP